MLFKNDSLDGIQFDGSNHPQYDILKSHIERSVQEIFLRSLRYRSDDLIHVFRTEDQVDGFIKRILEYWESLEKYEICQEVLILSKDFKKKWSEFEGERNSFGFFAIKDFLFNNKKE